MKKSRTAFKTLSALLLVALMAFLPLTAGAEGYLTGVELINAVRESNLRLSTYGAENMDVSYCAIPIEVETTDEIVAKAVEVTAGLSTDREKAEAINKWVCENIYYDYDYYYHHTKPYPNYMPKVVFETGIAVCSGYARLFRSMLRAVGIPARVAAGSNYMYDGEYEKRSLTHDWVEVYFDGKWNMCDPTWDSGNKYEYGKKVDGSYRDTYFAMNPNQFSISHFTVRYEDDLKIGDYIYSLSVDNIKIKQYVGDKSEPVNAIIPDDVNLIAESVFAGCENLVSVKLPLKLKEIESSTFKNCTSLETVEFGGSLKTIERNAFSGCTSLRSVILPEGVEKIESGAFNGCTALESVYIPDSVTSIGDNAFKGCTALKTVHIGAGIKSLPDSCFYQCSNLETITGGENIVRIGQYCFRYDEKYTGNDFLMNLNYMGEYALQGCKSVKRFRLPKYNIDNPSNFFGLTALEEVVISEGCQRLPYSLFYKCVNLKKINIPSSVTEFGDSLFGYCSSLESITVPDGITTIQYETFTNCKALKTVYIPASVTSIGNRAFGYCDSLETVYFSGTQEQWNQIEMNSGNEALKNATVVFGHTHSFKTTVIRTANCIQTGLEESVCIDCGFSKSETKEKAEHSYKVTQIIEPTCEKSGYSVYTCTVCGSSVNKDAKEATGHNYEWIVDREATCEQSGRTYPRCTVCKKEFTLEEKIIPQLSHSSSDWIIDKDATCAKTGSKHKECTVCHKELETAVINVKTHTYGEWIIDKNATCTENGLRHRICSVCNSNESEIIAALGHNWNSRIIDKSPTCTEKGESHVTCTKCGEVSKTFEETLPHEASSEWVVRTEPSCNRQGQKDLKCKNCGKTLETRSIPMLEHTDNDKDGICDVCSAKIIKEPTCSHICHKTGFSGFLWKIINIFNKLFKINKECSCGKYHW